MLTAALLLLPATASAQQLAVTIDDLPAHGPLPPGETRLSVARSTIAALRAVRVPAYGFANGSFGDADAPRVLAAWRRAGLPLGDHGFGHLALSKVGPSAFVADIDRNRRWMPALTRRFRYPFLDEGSAAAREQVRAALARRGYRIAAVTMSFADYAYNAPYARCVARGDRTAVARLEADYLAAARADAERARAVYGARTPQVLLLHIGAFGARMLPRLLSQYRALGFRFAPLDTVQRAPLYRATDPAVAGAVPGVPPEAIGPAPPGADVCPLRSP